VLALRAVHSLPAAGKIKSARTANPSIVGDGPRSSWAPMFPLLSLSSLVIIKRLIEASHEVVLTPAIADMVSITSGKLGGKEYQLLKKVL
jgi:hypothetical protein